MSKVVGILLAGLLPMAGAEGCGGGRSARSAPHRPVTGQRPQLQFRRLAVKATVLPASGGVHTVFRIRISVRQPLGIWGRTIHGYEAHLLKDKPIGPCIIDTDGHLQSGRARDQVEIVLDPAQTMGHQWCPGPFRGDLRYYEAFACPASGVCQIPPHFPEHSGVVARIAFTVHGRAPY